MHRNLVSLLLLTSVLGVAAPADAQTTSGTWQLPDDTDDTSLRADTVPVPAEAPTTPLNAYADLLRVEIDQEDDVEFRVSFFFKDLQAPDEGQIASMNQMDLLRLAFELQGSTVNYTLDLILWRTALAETPGFATQIVHWGDHQEAALCLRSTAGACYGQAIEPIIDYDGNVVRVLVPKNGLLGTAKPAYLYEGYGSQAPKTPPPGTPKRLGVGDQLHKIRATYEPLHAEWGFPNAGWSDAAGGANAPLFAFQHPTANVAIAFPFLNHFWEPTAIDVGGTTPIEVLLEIREGPKRIVNLTYAVETSEEASPLLTVTGPASVVVGLLRPVNLTVAVKAAPGLEPRTPVNLTIRGYNVAKPSETAYAKLSLEPTVALGPNVNKLYFHAKTSDEPWCDAIGCWADIWLNSVPQDPDETPNAEPYFSNWFDGTTAQQQLWFSMRENLAHPIAFDASKPVEFNLAIRSPVDANVNLRLNLQSSRAGMIAEANQAVDIGPARTVQLSLPVAAPDLLLDRGEHLRMEIILTSDATNPAGFATLSSFGQIKLSLKDSHILLPLAEIPETLQTGSLLAPFALHAAGESQEDFINPGEGRLFNVTVLNRGAERDTTHLRASLDQPSWKVRVLPGSDFTLNSGESIVVGVLVEAPVGTPEGTLAAIRLNATSDLVPNEAAFLRLTLTSTSGADLPDDSKNYRVDPEAKEKLVDAGPSKKSTPGFEAVLLLGSLLAFALRRRSQNK